MTAKRHPVGWTGFVLAAIFLAIAGVLAWLLIIEVRDIWLVDRGYSVTPASVRILAVHGLCRFPLLFRAYDLRYSAAGRSFQARRVLAVWTANSAEGVAVKVSDTNPRRVVAVGEWWVVPRDLFLGVVFMGLATVSIRWALRP